MKKLLIAFILIVVIVVGGAITYVKVVLPSVGSAPDLTINITPERIERGKYLANHVAVCIDCHSERNWNKFAAPPMAGTFGGGGEVFTEEFGFPGTYYAKNITPFGIGQWTDGELFRAITTGVTQTGDAMFPVMPYPHYGLMNEEDLFSIIAYIRTLEPIKKEIPQSESNFPVNFIINIIPQPAQFSDIPDKGNLVEYGKYITNMAGCIDCHTKQVRGKLVEGMHFAGGFEFKIPQGTVVSSNITMDRETGIGSWNADMFVARFKQYADSGYVSPPVGPKSFQTVMPWTMYGGMHEEDLRAIYAYISSLQPISNDVGDKFIP